MAVSEDAGDIELLPIEIKWLSLLRIKSGHILMKENVTTLLAVEAYVQEHTREVRGEKVLTDANIAALYEISLTEVRRIVARNKRRFPPDFLLVLNEEEKKRLSLKGKKVYGFTWRGILMLGGQLKSSRAIRTHMQMIELFVGSIPGKVFEVLSEIQNHGQRFDEQQ